MSPRFIYFLQLLTLLAMVASAALPNIPHVATLAAGAIVIERTFKPLCVGLIQRTLSKR